MIKKGTKRGKFCFMVLVCDLLFPPSLSFTQHFLCSDSRVMWVVSCCQDNILPCHTLPSFDLPFLACTFRKFVPCLFEDSYRRTAEADSYFPLVGTILFLPVGNAISIELCCGIHLLDLNEDIYGLIELALLWLCCECSGSEMTECSGVPPSLSFSSTRCP